jgi:broad specificity polyphosphatase/5'/3'-nucleotidase SurE
VGSNLGIVVPFSGTVGAACYAAHEEGIPAIAFSGASEGNVAYTEPAPKRSLVYAELATELTNKIIESGKPYLPKDVFLNVNFPEVGTGCEKVSDFQWVLSRINTGFFSPPDVEWCRDDRLPTERDVVGEGCYVSVSIGDASDKTTMNDAKKQKEVLTKIEDMLVCLP